MSVEQNLHNQKSQCTIDKPLFEVMLRKGFWAVYPLMGICFLHVLWLMNDRIDNIMYNTVPIHEKPAAFVDTAMAIPGSVQKGMDLNLVKTPSKEMLQLGRETFQNQCVMCHGAEGKGDGPAGGGVARNFHSKDGWKNGREFGHMFGTLKTGTTGGMPPFDTLPVSTRISLIHYVRSFTGDFPAIQDSEVAELDKQYHLSKDSVSAHRIPIVLAKQLEIRDAQSVNAKNHEVAVLIQKDTNESAKLLQAYTVNLERTLVSLQSSPVWKKDLDSFIKFLMVNVNVNGVKPELLLLEKSQLEGLYTYLKDIK